MEGIKEQTGNGKYRNKIKNVIIGCLITAVVGLGIDHFNQKQKIAELSQTLSQTENTLDSTQENFQQLSKVNEQQLQENETLENQIKQKNHEIDSLHKAHYKDRIDLIARVDAVAFKKCMDVCCKFNIPSNQLELYQLYFGNYKTLQKVLTNGYRLEDLNSLDNLLCSQKELEKLCTKYKKPNDFYLYDTADFVERFLKLKIISEQEGKYILEANPSEASEQ